MGRLDLTLEQYNDMCRQEPRFAKWHMQALEQRERDRLRTVDARKKRAKAKRARMDALWRKWRATRARKRT